MRIDTEMTPEGEAAAHAELAKEFREKLPDVDEPTHKVRELLFSRPDGEGFLYLCRQDNGRMLLGPSEDGKLLTWQYYISEAGELKRLELEHNKVPEATAQMAADFADTLKNGTLLPRKEELSPEEAAVLGVELPPKPTPIPESPAEIALRKASFRRKRRPSLPDAIDKLRQERGDKEPPVSDKDILAWDDLLEHAGNVIKYTRDGGETWNYAKLDTGAIGGVFVPGQINAFPEKAMAIAGREDRYDLLRAITEKDFEDGLVVRPTTKKETRRMKFDEPKRRGRIRSKFGRDPHRIL